MTNIVVMGVAGCGKSTVAQALAKKLNLDLLEGDDFHSPQNREKMRLGNALTDADRADWLDILAKKIALAKEQNKPIILTCSALKNAYRNRLRQADSSLCFVFLELDIDAAKIRVSQRSGEHFFPVTLVENQFATLQNPRGEKYVVCVNAQSPVEDICKFVSDEISKFGENL